MKEIKGESSDKDPDRTTMPSRAFWTFVKGLKESAETWKDKTDRNCWGTWEAFENVTDNIDEDEGFYDEMVSLTDALEEKITVLQDDPDLENTWINGSEMERTDYEVSIIMKGSRFYNKIINMTSDDLKKWLLEDFHGYNFGHVCSAYCYDKGWECDAECDCLFDKEAKTVIAKAESTVI